MMFAKATFLCLCLLLVVSKCNIHKCCNSIDKKNDESSVYTFCDIPNKALSEDGSTIFSIRINGDADEIYTVNKINISINLNNTCSPGHSGDFIIDELSLMHIEQIYNDNLKLVGPDYTNVVLASNSEIVSNWGYGVSCPMVSFTLNDAGTGSFEDWFDYLGYSNGNCVNNQSLTPTFGTLNYFVGDSITGKWKLTITAGSYGYYCFALHSWCLSFA